MAKGKKNRKTGKVLLSKKARRKRARPRARDKLVTRHWRGRLTVKGNYKRMGLASNPNRRSKEESGSKIVSEIEQSANDATKRQEATEVVYVDWYNKQMLQQLIDKYGCDYEAMSRDVKVNVWQRTAGQLRRQCQRLSRALN